MKRTLAAFIGAGLLASGAQAQRPDIRPTYHFAPQRNWMNDPNGLVYYDGEYHLFFQYNPYGDRWGHMSWGHAVSRDLVHWQQLPVAIPETDVMAFSGSAVVDWDNTSGFGQGGKPPMVAIYTGQNVKTGNQSQFVAYSNDHGRHWTVHGKVLDIGSTAFRDPKVFWHAATRRWVMVAVMADENRAVIYTSPNLKDWRFASSFGPAGRRGKNWECPDLFELPVEGGAPGEKRWVLSINLGDNAVAGGSGGQYFVGDFDGTTFKTVPGWGDQPRWLDYGADFYATVSWNDLPKSDPRRIWIGWANNWRYANDIPTYPSRGLMTVPRAVTLHKTADGYRLAQAPVKEIEALRGAPQVRHGLTLGETPVPLPVSGGSDELAVDLDTGSARQIALTLTDGEGYQTVIGVNPAVDEVFIDRTRSGPHFFDGFEDRHIAPVDLGSGKVRLHVLVDQSIIELFINNGSRTITDRFFRGGGALRWSASALGGTATMDVTAWPLGPERNTAMLMP
uniref:Inulinase n=2 Tax=Bacteria TaxID=2 RepID=A0A0F6MTX2_9SPHN|nr:inulinase precursor [Sphingomonas sp. JB13]